MRYTLDPFGISDHYRDIFDKRRETSLATREALQAAMGGVAPSGQDTVRVVRAGQPAPGLAGELELEDGGSLRLTGEGLPPDLPLGYHWLQPLDAPRLRLIVAPERCWLPDSLRGWGWAVQLYSVRSGRSWGMGDLGDLGDLASWARELGAQFLLINPMPAVAPVAGGEPSPYYPSSRCFKNPLYLRIEGVPGAAELAELPALAAAGHALNHGELIDRGAVFALKKQALQALWERFAGDPSFDRFCQQQGELLVSFARYCVLAERYGSDWRCWPEELRNPHSAAVARDADQSAGRLAFFKWLQWLLDEQLARAAEGVLLVQDLPIGVDPGGADAWMWQGVLASGASIGAPPDHYCADGQNWGLPPFIPHRLRETGYEPFARTIRASLRHCRGLRIDHVMGLFRLFCIPHGRPPVEGAYVYYPADELLAITALESQRASAFMIGEDLGTVEEGTRERLAAHLILSYRLLWFEECRPGAYPELALAAANTHDLPTVAGLWTGSDLEEQRALGLRVNKEDTERLRARLRDMTGIDDRVPLAEVIERTYRLLAETPSRLLTATLEDVVAAERRPNVPATRCQERPNWSLPLPNTLEELMQAPLARRLAQLLSRQNG